MKLLTFGGVSVEGVTFRREKPLLLLAYLCLEGPQPRRRLASLFWPDAANPMNSLAQNLIRLRPLTGAVLEHGNRVEALIPSDIQDFRDHCRAARPADALTLYTGAFLDGLNADLNPDLEEWLLDTRETLAREARAAHLTLAEHHHAHGQHPQAHAHATHAYHTPGAPPCDPEDLPRLWQILGLSDHPLTLTLRRDAHELGLTLPTPTPTLPTTPLIGRTAELATLSALPAGQIAWISGPPGIGKTALIDSLTHTGWRVLPARSGLPLATLEPLSAHPLGSAADALNLLRDTRLKLALDDWEDMDDTTRATLTLAARQHPGATIAITARQPPALPTHHHLPLHSLTEHDLQGHPGAHAATGGHPTLLAAYLNGTPPDRTLDAHLTLLGPDHRRLFLALAAQDTPNLSATRAALNLSAATLAGTLDTLTREGLTTPTGTIRASTPARQLLDAHPLDTTLIHLHLARHYPRETAWPHWLAARDLWEDHDHTPCAAAAHWHADQELKRGYPAKAARTLENAPQTDEVRLLRGWALIYSGEYQNALEVVSKVADSPEAQVARASVLFRTGENEKAYQLAVPLKHGNSSVSAHATFVLGLLHRHREDYEQARQNFRRSARLWHLQGNLFEEVQSASLAASAACRLHQSAPDNAFEPILARAEGQPAAEGLVLINYAVELEHAGQLTQVTDLLSRAAEHMTQSGNLNGVAIAANNLGLRHHLDGNLVQAKHWYRESIDLTIRTGDIRLLGLALSNLSELEADLAGLEDALMLLTESGQSATVELIQRNLKANLIAMRVS
ncbi:hypothetical protein [Deinococcus sp. 12RED42]|uniref:hypothetical protein n=1 Tax=Deinococcus sp. 12RED42 TaxID=2745872 RepID=UPI001E5898C2|nr:hypothetical protein [Deinococcus sp. 12RED42]MCD0165462.1 hypothetical protein [Deinococcus sp. 12RED42]